MADDEGVDLRNDAACDGADDVEEGDDEWGDDGDSVHAYEDGVGNDDRDDDDEDDGYRRCPEAQTSKRAPEGPRVTKGVSRDGLRGRRKGQERPQTAREVPKRLPSGPADASGYP